ncbi:L-type lectin-domain containing receptor kinase IX.1-like [Oryza brachyantha]|uniref:non-specific serine/threonine protein kinase n=1 Tax=Oryza brachyantha TaxID=4533 RepID=J3LVH3_ORYBR|nr:L-type lectin-domain containing receptor kinase IX.1-like [Oryza brachyantha]AHW98494.1 protein kinase [Oryza brachyantha]
MEGWQAVGLLLGVLLLDAPHYSSSDASPAFSFDFDFANTSSYSAKDLKFEGDAAVHGGFVDLTCNDYVVDISQCKAGRMSYNHPVRFYDQNTKEVASFSTRFSFRIVGPVKSDKKKGDGMAFFLSGYPSNMPTDSQGGNLGLISNKIISSSGPKQFISVEFDTFVNSWESPKQTGDHMGIYINTVTEAKTTQLLNFTNGTMNAFITFNSTTSMLVASLNITENPNYHYNVSANLSNPRDYLPSDIAVGFSAAVDVAFEVHQILSWSFNSTLAAPEKGHDHKAITVGLSIGGPLMFVFLVWSILSWWKWRNTNLEFDKGTCGVRRFKYHHLVAATNHFSTDKQIGAGAFGEVYKGWMKELGREVAIKKILKECRSEGSKDFFDEVKALSRAKQKNLIELLGWGMKQSSSVKDFMRWCRQNKTEVFLVYELVDNGNLHTHLHEEAAAVLPWRMRYKIVKDICSALIYLHHDRDPYILHRDIKPSNILLDKNFNAKLADFGLSRSADNGTFQTSMVVGTANYLDPECMKTGMFNRSSDVYSFGLVLLEIACKKDENSYAQVWQRYIDKTLMLAADDRLQGAFDERQMERVIVLGLWCCTRNTVMRPTMEQAMDFLEHDLPLPQLAKPEASDLVILTVDSTGLEARSVDLR